MRAGLADREPSPKIWRASSLRPSRTSILRQTIESAAFERAVIALIVANAVTLGLETSPAVMARHGGLLHAIDRLFLYAFTVELALRLFVYRLAFFRDPWRLFDLVVVGIAWLPAGGALSVLRALRILRVLRLVSMIPSLRRVVGGLIAALPGMGSIMALLTLVFYVFSVMATKLFGASFPQLFGSLGASAYTLFQIMTLEGWSGEVVRPVMETYPYAWAFFIPFIVCTTFTVLNLFIGIIVSAMQQEHEESAAADRDQMLADREAIVAELRSLRAEIAALRKETA